MESFNAPYPSCWDEQWEREEEERTTTVARAAATTLNQFIADWDLGPQQ